MIKNIAHVDFNDKNTENVRFVKVNSMTAVREHFTRKLYVDQAFFYNVHESSLLRLLPEETMKLDERDSITLNSSLTSLKLIIQLPTKSYVDSLHESSRNRPDVSSVFNDQDNEFDNDKLPNLDSVTVNSDPSSDIESSTRKYIDNELDRKN